MAADTAFKFENIKPGIGARIYADKSALLSGEHADQIRAVRAMPYPLDSGRMMHRTKLQGEEAIV